MAKKVINVGLAANDGTGDSLRVAGGKINENFTEVYDALSTAYSYTLPKASASVLGGVKVGANLSINASTGVLSASVPNDLTDLNIVDGIVGQYLTTDGDGNFSFASLPSAISNLNDLGDVVLTGPTANQYLKYNGASWVNSTLALTTSLSGLTDVDLNGPTAGQVLKFDGTSWINDTDAGGSGNPFDQSLNTTDQVEFVKVTAEEVDLSGSGTPTVYSETDLYLSATGKISVVTKSQLNLGKFTTTEVNNLSNKAEGDIWYNTTTDTYQGYANGAVVSLSGGGSANLGAFTFATNRVTVAGNDMEIRTTRTGFDVDADVDILAADDVFIEAAGDEVGISAASEVTITTNTLPNMHPTNWDGEEEDFIGTWNGTTLTLTVPNGETTLITLLNYYTVLGNVGNIWLKTASGYVQTENTDPADKTIGTGETVFEIPLLASSPVANADIIRMKLYDSINGDPDKQWSFRKNGKLEFPNGGTIEPVGMGWIGLTNGTTGTPVSLVNRYSTDGLERSMLTLNGDVEGGSINLLAVNTTGESDVYHEWQFNDNGSLALPGGGIVSEGYVTSNPTIQLTPDAPAVASQKLVIKGGGNYSNTENGIIVTVNNITQLVGDTISVYVDSVANANQTLYWWTYPSSANSGVGGTVVIDEFGDGEFTFTLDNDDYEFRVRVSPEENNYGSGVIGAQSVLINSDEPTFNADNHLHLTTGDLTETSIFLGTDDHNVRTTVNGGIEITTPNTTNNVWTFGDDGVLSLPGSGIYAIGESEPGMVFTSSAGFGFVSDVDGISSPALIIGTDGKLTLPRAVVNSTVSKTGSNPDGNRVYFEVTEVDGSGTVTEITVINSPNPAWITPTSGIVYVDIDYSVNFDEFGNATVTVNSSGTGHSLGEAWDIAAEAVGATAPTPTALDLTKTVNKLANGLCTLADGVEGQIMYLVPQDGATISGIEVSIEHARQLSNLITPAAISNDVAYYPFAGADSSWHNNIATLIFTDGAWNVSTGSFD
jgi:hypothetical protein